MPPKSDDTPTPGRADGGREGAGACQPEAVRQVDGSILVKGAVDVRDVMEMLGSESDLAGYRGTVSGYVYSLLGGSPARGAVVEAGDVDIYVKTVSQDRATEFVARRSAAGRP